MQVNTIHVKTGSPYDVQIGEGLLERCGAEVRKVAPKARVAAIVTDDIVAPLYADRVECSLIEAGFEVARHTIKNGEPSKCHETLIGIYSFLNKSGVTRSDLLIALGGGVVGDITGYAAATYLRGVAYVQLPTTLLAQVDSSVGGKTAVDIPEGKNLVGAFWQPKLVVCDVSALATLPKETFADGAAEVIKYGAIWDAELFKRLEQGALYSDTISVITRCIDIKREVVEKDEFDKGLRALLNFGHTLGHAIEAESGYTVTHGAAVAVGMVLIAQISQRMRLTDGINTKRLTACIARHGLKTETGYSMQELYPHCFSDKKCEGDSITLVLLHEIGMAFLYTAKNEDLKGILGIQ
ncbi:3-dehydroquinate synthase [Acetanaerobacterium elongatum]|uniref:3-dehydroquinate synthase n=1 Tax=Acetanaerobacterium elongatum TaxID=258515 RepID=A0A1H0EP55_9FIRM|nr:3-dehydroquinate synthase [Acetanaerobacterium elongatum]SDN84184.1 3-dehydroquinate synthase [Acetanaerobacterium elongatum]